MTEFISSKQNPKIKQIIQLQKSSERRELGLFLLEGIKETEKAVAAGYTFEQVYFCEDIISEDKLRKLVGSRFINNLYKVDKQVFEKIAYRESTGGILSVVQSREHRFEDLNLTKNPLILVIEGVEKPGNIGAIYRTADAAGVDAILICDPKVDFYNPNAIRASIGCIFQIPTVISDTPTAIDWINEHKISIYPTYLKAAVPYTNIDFKQASAIVMGTEATGITDEWIKHATQNIIIPMKGSADSLNVSTSAAIVTFEAARQRGF